MRRPVTLFVEKANRVGRIAVELDSVVVDARERTASLRRVQLDRFVPGASFDHIKEIAAIQLARRSPAYHTPTCHSTF